MSEKKIELTGKQVIISINHGDYAIVTNSGTQPVKASTLCDVEKDTKAYTINPNDKKLIPFAIRGNLPKELYLLGTGTVIVEGTDISSSDDPITKSEVDKMISEAVSGISDRIGANLLDNPDFHVNQREKSGTITDAGYFVDRWKLKDGSVTVNADKTLTLNGTMTQLLETDPGVSAAASCSSEAAVCSYESSTKTFTISTTAPTIISWAKLEAGNKATPFVKPAFAAELAKCQRYLYVLRGSLLRAGLAEAYSTSYALFYLYAPASFRTVPSVSFENVVLSSTKDGSVYSEAANIQVRGGNSNVVKLLVNAADALTIGEQYELSHKPGTTGSLLLSAEL